jgi:transcriptional regulator with XRE-family HTH domain
MNPYASRLRKIRVSHDYSQEYMALKLGITLSAYSKIERGKTELTISRLVQIAEILQFDLPRFFEAEPAVQVEEPTQVGYGFVTRAEFMEHVDKLHLVERQLSDILSKLPQ